MVLLRVHCMLNLSFPLQSWDSPQVSVKDGDFPELWPLSF
jgi:hypothetical protein